MENKLKLITQEKLKDVKGGKRSGYYRNGKGTGRNVRKVVNAAGLAYNIVKFFA